MTKKERIVYYSPLCTAILLHVAVFLFLFFRHDAPSLSSATDDAPVVFSEAGDVGTARGIPEGTEVVSHPEPLQQDMIEEVAQAPSMEPESPEIVDTTPAEPDQPLRMPTTDTAPAALPRANEVYYAPQTVPVTPPAETPVQKSTPPRRRRAAWHAVSPEARTRATRLNIQQSVRTFTDQHYDAYGTPNGSGGSSDRGNGTGGGGNAQYHAHINSLDLIRQSYMKKVVRAIVAQSNFMQLMTHSDTPIHTVMYWRIEIGPDAKIKNMHTTDSCTPSIDAGLRKIFYATQLPPLPTRLKDGFVWRTSIMIQHAAQTAPMVLTSVDE